MAKASGTRGKGEGSVYQEKSGRWVGSIEVGYVDGKRRRKRAVASTRAEAMRKLRVLRREVEDGLVADNATVEKWMDHWLDVVCVERGLKPRTVYGYRGLVAHHVVPVIGRVELRRLTPDHVRAVHRHVTDAGLADATVRKVHAILSRALKVAEREGRIRRNPATMVDAPPPARNPHAVLSVSGQGCVGRGRRGPGGASVGAFDGGSGVGLAAG